LCACCATSATTTRRKACTALPWQPSSWSTPLTNSATRIWPAERIAQLGGEPDFNPDVLAKRSHTEYVPGGDLLDMIREDLVAERIAVATYAEIVRWLGDGDPTTRRLIERLLAEEEGHADDLRNLLDRLDT